MSDEVKDHCGVVGICGDDKAAYKAYLGMYALPLTGRLFCWETKQQPEGVTKYI